MAKYKRHPSRQAAAERPTPSFVGEILHVDIFSTDGTLFLTCVDKFSKLATVEAIASRAIVDIKAPLVHIIQYQKPKQPIAKDHLAPSPLNQFS